ncbi:MAG: two-component sensor histidine kinase [Lachnospiraceae bacterium]|nr:two-component sensor histidine kinase [Lachnospiraceae bacterium]
MSKLKQIQKYLGDFFKSFISIRSSIFIIMLIVGIVPAFILYVGILQNYETKAVELRANTVQNQLKVLSNHLVTYNYLENPDSDVISAELEMISNLYEGRVLIISGNYQIIKDTYSISQGKYMLSEEILKCFRGESITRYDKVDGYIEMTTPIKRKVTELGEHGLVEREVVTGVMFTSISNSSIVDTLEVLSHRAFVLLSFSMVIIVVVAGMLSRLLVGPFKRLSVSISNIKNGYFDEFTPVNTYVETRQITDAFTELMGRMKVLDDSRQEFVANVSHELKTPLTSMKVLADSIAGMGGAPIELYEEFFKDITAEIDRENQIITDLLALVKMDKKAAELVVEPIDMADLLELILKRLRPLARKKDVELVLECIRPVTAEVDEVKMNLVFTNLIENAIKYNKDYGSVKVILDADHKDFKVEVRDTGIGISKEDAEHIYERFYRVDKSHSREIGGTGLGLAITKNAIMMHRGTIFLDSTPGEGSTFTVTIPLTHQKG